MKKPWATNTANLSRPTSRTTSSRGLRPHRLRVLDSSSCVTSLASACDLSFARSVSLATLPEEQPRWHTAAGKHHLHCESRPSPTLLWAGRKNRAMAEPLVGSMECVQQKRCPRTGSRVFSALPSTWPRFLGLSGWSTCTLCPDGVFPRSGTRFFSHLATDALFSCVRAPEVVTL